MDSESGPQPKKSRSHKSLGSVTWSKRLQDYAFKKYAFGRGQKSSDPKILAAVEKIDRCPAFKNLCAVTGRPQFTLYGNRPLACTCGYHVSLSVYLCIIISEMTCLNCVDSLL